MRCLLIIFGIGMLGGCGMRSTAPVAAAPRLDAVPVTYGFSNRTRATFAVTPEEWDRVELAFTPRTMSAAGERQRIRRGVAIMEQIAGAKTPTGADVGGNGLGEGGAGQMDCVNEAENTTTYIRLFQEHGFILHHALLTPVFRAPKVVDPHNAAQILDLETGERWVVDSWFLDNGMAPMLQPYDDWHAGQPFPHDVNRWANVSEEEDRYRASARRWGGE